MHNRKIIHVIKHMHMIQKINYMPLYIALWFFTLHSADNPYGAYAQFGDAGSCDQMTSTLFLPDSPFDTDQPEADQLFDGISLQNYESSSTTSSSTSYRPESVDTSTLYREIAATVNRLSEDIIYTCNEPNCGFTAKATDFFKHLNKHIAELQTTPLDEKIYKCDHPECTYATKRKGDLKRHNNIHSNAKPFTCEHVGCAFSSKHKSNLVKHKRTHGVNAVFCSQRGCLFKSTRTAAMKTHIRIYHAKSKKKSQSKSKRQRTD